MLTQLYYANKLLSLYIFWYTRNYMNTVISYNRKSNNSNTNNYYIISYVIVYDVSIYENIIFKIYLIIFLLDHKLY